MQTHHMADTPTAADHVFTARIWEADTLPAAAQGWGRLSYEESVYHYIQAIAALFGPQGEMR